MSRDWEPPDVETAPDVVEVEGVLYQDGTYVDEDNHPTHSDCYNSNRYQGRNKNIGHLAVADICGNRVN